MRAYVARLAALALTAVVATGAMVWSAFVMLPLLMSMGQ